MSQKLTTQFSIMGLTAQTPKLTTVFMPSPSKWHALGSWTGYQSEDSTPPLTPATTEARRARLKKGGLTFHHGSDGSEDGSDVDHTATTLFPSPYTSQVDKELANCELLQDFFGLSDDVNRLSTGDVSFAERELAIGPPNAGKKLRFSSTFYDYYVLSLSPSLTLHFYFVCVFTGRLEEDSARRGKQVWTLAPQFGTHVDNKHAIAEVKRQTHVHFKRKTGGIRGSIFVCNSHGDSCPASTFSRNPSSGWATV